MGQQAGSGGGISMQKDQVTQIGSNVTDLGTAVTQMQTYSTTNPITAAQFGTVEGASDAASLFVSTINALATSVGKAATFLDSAQKTIAQSVSATSLTDEEAMWGITNAGKGA